ncbi:hypothetical protein CA13_00640 [Planctomycetes bacterium CA13]|uniref:Uncharacterized protein n=1 Tax=Novipirellula herctigrandis TaxID=2527986 RepID=A0A5C5YUJ9_9BACT|nr:hypothetical protein CA13_00640 [Planctomycetes bacterium CA13]
MTNPYATPRSTGIPTSQATIASVIRMWMALVGSLVATVPVGLVINLILFDIESIRLNDETAYFWFASSVIASLVCSSATARLTTLRLTSLHFWIVYQLGWLAYLLSGGIGESYNQITSVLYLWTPFIVPAIVAVVAPFFNASPSHAAAPQAGG